LAPTTVLALACGGHSGQSSAGSGSGSGSGGGVDPAVESACGGLYDALIGCSPGNPPADEVARVRTRFQTLCSEALALPGQGVTIDSLNACAGAVKKDGCTEFTSSTSSCVVSAGSLGVGSPCQADSQCQSGACTAGVAQNDGGTNACGSCFPSSAVGQPCEGHSCGPDATCALVGKSTNATCVSNTVSDSGGSCDLVTKYCKPGLTCSSANSQCAVPATAGAQCGYDGDCAPPLVCPPVAAGSKATCQAPGQSGAYCSSDTHCASGLGCNPSSQTCSPIHWASAGQPCDGGTRCLVGSCPLPQSQGDAGAATSATCPAIIADGKPCDARSTAQACDTLANCVDSLCVLGYESTCK
jgi:hypothetical protein